MLPSRTTIAEIFTTVLSFCENEVKTPNIFFVYLSTVRFSASRELNADYRDRILKLKRSNYVGG